MSNSPQILIIGPAWVGDMVIAQCLFKTLKHADADADITVLAPAWSMPVLARMPEVARAECMPAAAGHGRFAFGVRRRIGREFRASRFDRAIVLPNSWKSALVPWFARIPVRTGYVGEQRFGLLNDIRQLGSRQRRLMPQLAQRFVALGLPKSSTSPTEIPQPKLAVQPAAVLDAVNRAAEFGLTPTATGGEAVALCPGAEYGPAKRWPPEYFAEVANAQLAQGRQVWLFGSANDREIAARINELCEGRCADLAGRTTLGEAADLLSLARYAVTNDSGLMHIAAAVGCHVVALYGSSSDTFTPPLTERCDRLSLALPCSPCFRRECPLGHLDCLKKLPPERVSACLG